MKRWKRGQANERTVSAQVVQFANDFPHTLAEWICACQGIFKDHLLDVQLLAAIFVRAIFPLSMSEKLGKQR